MTAASPSACGRARIVTGKPAGRALLIRPHQHRAELHAPSRAGLLNVTELTKFEPWSLPCPNSTPS